MKISIKVVAILFVVNSFLFPQTNISFYSDGMRYFNQGVYSRAITSFEEFISNSTVEQNLLSSAKLYIGESLLGLEQYNGAISQFENFVDEFPTSNLRELALYRLGNLYFTLKLYDKSRSNLEMLISQYPNSQYVGTSFHLIGESYIEENNFISAERFFSSAVNSKNNNAFVDRSIFALANLYEKKGEYKKAVESYDKILGFHRNSEIAAQAQLRIGICYFQLKEFDNSVLELSDPLISELDVKDRNDADYILANCFYNLKEYDSASEAYKRILSNSPSEDMMNKIRYGLAWIYFQQKDYSNSYKLFSVLSQSKDDSIALKSFYWSGESKRYEGKYAEAIEIHKRFALQFPDHPLTQSVKLNIGISKFSESSFEASEESLLQSLQSSDIFTKAKAHTLLGEISLRKNDFITAKNYFDKGLNLSPITSELKDRCLLGSGAANLFLKNNVEALKRFNQIDESNTKIDLDKYYYYRAEVNFFLGKFSKAISDYDKIVTTDLQITLNALYGKAYAYFNLKEFSKASYYFNEFINKTIDEKKLTECQLRLADCYYVVKDFKKASNFYKKALSHSNEISNDDRSYFNYAQSLFKIGESSEAIEVLEKIQAKFPASEYADDSQYLIGWINFQRNDYNGAIADYNKLFAIYPESNLKPVALYSTGDSYFNLGEYEKAISSYKTLITQFPNTQYVYDAVNGIQYCYVVQDQQDNAIKYLEEFIFNHSKLDFLDKIYYKIGEIYYSSGSYQSAISAYNKLAEKFPKSSLISQTYYWMGKSAILLPDDAQAIPYFENVIAGSINSEEGINSVLELGGIYKRQNHTSKELSLYDQVLPKISDSKRISQIKFVKALGYIENQDISSAYRELNEIIDKRDNSLFYHKAEIELGILELVRNNYDSALELFNDVAKNRTDDISAQAKYYIGMAYFQQNKIAEAITELIKVRSVYTMYDEWYTKTLLLLGDCYVINNDKANAANMFKSVLKRHRQNQYAIEAKEKLDKL